jgi:hypothetical protein
MIYLAKKDRDLQEKDLFGDWPEQILVTACNTVACKMNLLGTG